MEDLKNVSKEMASRWKLFEIISYRCSHRNVNIFLIPLYMIEFLKELF